MTDTTLGRKEFIAYLERGQIPPLPPDGATKRGYGFDPSVWIDDIGEWYNARNRATARGMWAIVDLHWTRQLAAWLDGRKVLEVMAGAGWLAKALASHGVSVTATDDYTWDSGTHVDMRRVYPVKRMDAVKAVQTYRNHDVLIVSWPPYGDGAIVDVCEAWGSDRPIVYIGESQGGCNAPDAFFEGFEVDESAPAFDLLAWDGIHDDVHIGYWQGAQR